MDDQIKTSAEAAEAVRDANAIEVATYEGHIRALHCDVCTRTHGNAHVSLGQRRGVIDAIPDHHDATLSVHVANGGQLVFRHHLGLEPDIEPLGDGGSCAHLI